MSAAGRQTLVVRLQGALLLGGAGQRANLLLCLRGSDGAPYIPASALKGAIREQLTRLHDRSLADTILGCAPDRSGPVPRRRDGGTTRVFIGDARLAPEQAHEARNGRGFLLRSSVSIDRRTGRAADQRLFSREVFDPAEPAVFRADVDARLLGDDERASFRAAVHSVYAIGSGRSVGLGAVEMSLEDAAPSEAQATLPGDTDLVLWLEAVEPLCLGFTRSGRSNFRPTLDFIPASTLRGAIASAALAGRGAAEVDQSGDPTFKSLLLDRDTCLRFSDALPTDATPDAGATLPRRAPFSLRSCKAEPATHGHIDTLVQSWLVEESARRGLLLAPSDDCGCEGCGERAAQAKDWLDAVAPRKRVVTRVGLDPATGRGLDGQLFSLETIEPGTRFVARVRNVDADGRRLLEDAARHGLRVGRGRGQGYGRVRVVAVTAGSESPSVSVRVATLDRELRMLAACVPGLDAAGAYLVATLQTDLCPLPGSTGLAESAFLEALGLDRPQVLAGSVRAGQRGGYDTQAAAVDTPKAFASVVRADSTLLLALPRALGDDDLRRLEHLERHGIGARREEGYGSVRFSDPVHLPGWRRP